ncbi:hybrid sensor histidine kinase/response regulator [Yoonia sp. 67]|uniref:hybrid sensor histidine kinase/response regulator n=1 Tax=Yoonia sp. 67 TaxID=3081449 RepID=UPI002AFEDF3C|nr:ATP-binding protein [Yoonia sp. 67]
MLPHLVSAVRQVLVTNTHMSLVAVMLLGLSGAGLVFFAGKLRQEIDYLAIANSDNVQWSLAQFEVDLLELETTILMTGPAADLTPVRTRFDILYSRYQTVANSSQYAAMRGRSDIEQNLALIRTYLESSITYIDGPDTILRENLLGLVKQTDLLRPLVRNISLVGLETFARTADERRQYVVQILGRTSSLVIGLIIMLMVLVLLLLLLVRLAWMTSKDHALVANRLQSIVTTSLDAILVVDRDGKIVNFNGAAERIFGYSSDEAIGHNMVDLIVPAHLRDKHASGMTRYLGTGEQRMINAGRVRLDALRKCGTIFPAELSLSTAQSKQGEIFVAYISDISEIVTAQAELVEARDKAIAGEKSKAAFIAVMSHEMRTPLNGLLGALDLLSDTATNNGEDSALFDVMKKSGSLLLNHINDVLNISQLEAGMVDIAAQRFNANELVRDITTGQISNAMANVNTLVIDANDPSLSDVVGDPIRLRHILLNLLGNAIKFTHNGQITVQLSRLGDGVAVLQVTDTGIGIAEHDLSRIFDDFVTLDGSYSRSASGTGLGLGIAQRLAKAMHGTISVTSTIGKGSQFSLQMSLVQWQNQNDAVGNPQNPDSPLKPLLFSRPLDILLVEDNEINRIVVRGMLERSGHYVTESFDGQDGVTTANSRAFDVILMDISMPGMDGVLATHAIRQGTGASKDVPIIAVTAHALPADIARFEQARINEILIKPVSREALLQHIAAVIRDAPPRALSSVIAPDNSAQFVDNAKLQAMRDDFGADAAANLLAKFVSDTVMRLAMLPLDIVTDEDRAAAISQVHTLSGSAVLFGAVRLRTQLSTLETELKQGQNVNWHFMRDALISTWDQTRDLIVDKDGPSVLHT